MAHVQRRRSGDGSTDESADAYASPRDGPKHPLEHPWSFWFDNPTTAQTVTKYGNSLRRIYTFDTVEDFWCLYHHLRTPAQLQPSATFFLFKDGITPKWEDPRNAGGGCWLTSLPKTPWGKAVLDAYWVNAALACIGEQFLQSGEQVCGLAINVRAKADRLELWTRNGADRNAQMSIGQQLRTLLEIPDNTRLSYTAFAEKLGAGPKAKDMYVV